MNAELKNGSDPSEGGHVYPAAPIFKREDWTAFRSLDSLGQMAGVARPYLLQLAVKELVDNALDACGDASIAEGDDGTIFVASGGDGIPGTDAELAGLFSIGRPLTSSKLLRLPTRGALGNGLRVVTGLVLSTGGHLTVATRGRSLRLAPQDDGTTTIVSTAPYDGSGSVVSIWLPEQYRGDDPLAWGELAIAMADGGERYRGLSSPYWYDPYKFWELCQAWTGSARDLIANLDGCTGGKAGRIAQPWKGRDAASLTRDEARALLREAQQHAKEVRPERLGSVGPRDAEGYAKRCDSFALDNGRGDTVRIPYVAEVWARPAEDSDVNVYVNRTPSTGRAVAWVDDKKLLQIVADRRHIAAVPVGRKHFVVEINVTTPFCPITSEGKAPDLSHFALQDVIEHAVNRARRVTRCASGAEATQVATIMNAIPECAASLHKGRYRFSQRNLFYSIRKIMIDVLGKAPSMDYFCTVVGKYEDANGDIEGMYRDPRGALIHPFVGDDDNGIPLGTIAVEAYQRPLWTYSKILFVEKATPFPTLRAERWSERHDCALVSSQGQATRAIKDLFDLLADSTEPVQLFCVHDADGAGTIIYQALVEATASRPGRRLEVINLGLEPEEALDMGLEPEAMPKRKKKKANGKDTTVPVASYVPPKWREWLQHQRVEINAMAPDRLIEWLDRKIAPYETGKLVPPVDVLDAELRRARRRVVRERIVERVLREANVDQQVEDAVNAATPLDAAEALAYVRGDLERDDAQHWTEPMMRFVTEREGESCRR